MPDTGTIRAFKGKVDFYVVRGQVIARSWPRKTKHLPSAAEVAQQNHMKAAMVAYNSISPYQKALLYQGAYPGNWTTRDIFMKYFFGTIPPPVRPYPGPTAAMLPIPFPDPEGNYWGTKYAIYYNDFAGDPIFEFGLTTTGTFTLHLDFTPPVGAMTTYRRRGLDLPGGPNWHDTFTIHAQFDTTDAEGVVRFNLKAVFDLWQPGIMYTWFSKNVPTPAPNHFSPAFSPFFVFEAQVYGPEWAGLPFGGLQPVLSRVEANVHFP